jgi:hypothetical protein
MQHNAKTCPVADCVAIASWIGIGLNLADAMRLLYPEEAAHMTMLNLFPGPPFDFKLSKENEPCH